MVRSRRGFLALLLKCRFRGSSRGGHCSGWPHYASFPYLGSRRRGLSVGRICRRSNVADGRSTCAPTRDALTLTWGVAIWVTPVVCCGVAGAQHVLTPRVDLRQTAVVTFVGRTPTRLQGQRAVRASVCAGEMIDGLAMAETTPGPLILVLQFVGFVAAYRYATPLDPWLSAVLGACLTTWVTFVPSFAFIFIGAPYMESLRQHRGLNAALSCVTAAVVGVIVNLSVWFATHTLFGRVDARSYGLVHADVPVWSTLEPVALLLAAAAMIAMLRFKIGMAWTLAARARHGFTRCRERKTGTQHCSIRVNSARERAHCAPAQFSRFFSQHQNSRALRGVSGVSPLCIASSRIPLELATAPSAAGR